MQTKMGPNQVKMSIEHDFLYKRYSQALKTALEYIAAVEDEAVECKVSNPKEVVETAAMCAMKLGNMEIAMQCADKLVCNSSFLRHTHDMLAKLMPISFFFCRIPENSDRRRPEELYICTVNDTKMLYHVLWNITVTVFWIISLGGKI